MKNKFVGIVALLMVFTWEAPVKASNDDYKCSDPPQICLALEQAMEFYDSIFEINIDKMMDYMNFKEPYKDLKNYIVGENIKSFDVTKNYDCNKKVILTFLLHCANEEMSFYVIESKEKNNLFEIYFIPYRVDLTDDFPKGKTFFKEYISTQAKIENGKLRLIDPFHFSEYGPK